MADLARRREPRTGNPRALWDELDKLRREVNYLRGARGTIARGEFPAGVIPPNALQQATAQPGLVSLTVTGFALTTTPTAVLSGSAAVPAGFSGCVVSLVGRVYAGNTTASAGFLSAQAKINGVSGNAVPVHVGVSGQPDDTALNVATCSVVLTDLTPGAVVPVQLLAWTDAAAWTADAANLADLTGTVAWFA
jgi:hypothetical protein